MYIKTAIIDTRERVDPNGLSLAKKESLVPLSLLFFYLVLEYGRPQELLPFLSNLHLPGITIVLLALYSIIFRKFTLKDKQTTLFLLMLGLMVIHGPIAVNNYMTFWVFIAMLMNFIIFLSLIRYVDNPNKYEKLVITWLGIHIFLSIVGIVKEGVGIGGFLGDENDFCMAINMIIPFTFFLSAYSSGKKRIFYFFLTCLFLFVIMLTASRGGFVGLMATSIYCWIRTKRKVLTAFIIGLLAVFVVLAAPQTYWNEVRSISEEGASTGTGEERVYTWKIGWQMFLSNPIIGVGQGNFGFVFGEYEREVTKSDTPFHGRSIAGRAAHSLYFTLLPELGILGTCIFGGMIVYTLKDLKAIKARLLNQKHPVPNQLWNKHIAYVFALEGALISYFVSGAFISVLYYPNIWFLMGFIISLKKIVVQESNPITV